VTSYFGKDLKVLQSIDIKLTRPITSKDMKMEGGRRFEGYNAGDSTNRFDTKKEVIERGKEIFGKFFGEGWKLKIEDLA
jgi:hypothetical protein